MITSTPATYEALLAENARLAALASKVAALASKVDELASKLEARDVEMARKELLIERLTEQVKSLLAQRYGRRSEKLDAEELGQLVLAWCGPGAAEATDPTLPRLVDESDTEPPADEAPRPAKPRYDNGHPGRTKLSDDLERIVDEQHVPGDERACEHCGHELTFIKNVDHERVEFIPAKLVVHVERRELLACKQAGCAGTVVTAERDDPEASRCRLGHSLVAQLIEAKCQDGLPIERQRNQLERLGFEIPDSTLYSAWNRGCDLLHIVGEAHLGSVLAEDYVRLDDTRLDVLDRHRKGGTRRGHLWCFVGATGHVAYHFTETWRADEIAPLLHQIEGFAQTDDWAGYDSAIEDANHVRRKLVDPARRLGCGMHTRRRFYEDHKLGGKDSAAAIVYWRQLYEIEAYAKEKGLDPGQRHALRQEKSVPVMKAFDDWVDEKLVTARPQSRFGKALRYAKNQRPYLHRCLSDGRFELDNGEPERRLRKPAVGRNNWLFTGSNKGGRRLATAYGLVQTCIALGIPVRDYLIDVLTKIEAGWPMRRLGELLPARWNELHRPG